MELIDKRMVQLKALTCGIELKEIRVRETMSLCGETNFICYSLLRPSGGLQEAPQTYRWSDNELIASTEHPGYRQWT
jgi:hypothetical protein